MLKIMDDVQKAWKPGPAIGYCDISLKQTRPIDMSTPIRNPPQLQSNALSVPGMKTDQRGYGACDVLLSSIEPACSDEEQKDYDDFVMQCMVSINSVVSCLAQAQVETVVLLNGKLTRCTPDNSVNVNESMPMRTDMHAHDMQYPDQYLDAHVINVNTTRTAPSLDPSSYTTPFDSYYNSDIMELYADDSAFPMKWY